MKTYNSILLIDDSDSDNFLHTRILKKTGITDKIIVKNNGVTALEYLKEQIAIDSTDPELIFLDINMPGMNGWEFLEAYEKLEKRNNGLLVVVMLTTSLNPDDRTKAVRLGYVGDFINKPLNTDKVLEIYETFFKHRR